jgi:hypothetical protein
MRSALTFLLTCFSCLAIVLATLAFGVQQTLLNTDRWVAVVGPLASDPTVQSSVAETSVAIALNSIDAQGRAQSLPAPLRGLASPIESSVSTLVTNQAMQVVQSPQFAQLWVSANRTIHQALVQFLRSGEPPSDGAIKISDGQVEVNLLMLMPGLMDRVQQTVPAGVVSRLAPDFGYVSIGQSSTLANLEEVVQTIDAVTLTLIVAAPLLVIVTLIVSPRRLRTTMWLGIGVALGLLVAAAVLLVAQGVVVASMSGQPIVGVVQATLLAVDASLGIGMGLVLAASLLVALIAGLAARHHAEAIPSGDPG